MDPNIGKTNLKLMSTDGEKEWYVADGIVPGADALDKPRFWGTIYLTPNESVQNIEKFDF